MTSTVTPTVNNGATPVAEKSRAQQLLDDYLEGRPAEFSARLHALIQATGIRPDDPIFLLLVGSGQIEDLLDRAPQTLGQVLADYVEKLEAWWKVHLANLRRTEEAAIQEFEAEVGKVANRLLNEAIKKRDRQESQRFFRSLVPAVGILLGIFGIGMFAGITVPPYLQGGYVSERRLTQAEVNALTWAMSAEGKYAQQIMEWNQNWLGDRECEKEAPNLDITMMSNSRRATKGYCVIWTRPHSQRGLN